MTGSEFFLLLAASVAVARATHLVTVDAWPLTWKVRAWLGRWVWLAKMMRCPWCASGWLSLAVSGGLWRSVGLPVPPIAWGAIWGASCWVYWSTEAYSNAANADEEPPATLDDRYDFK